TRLKDFPIQDIASYDTLPGPLIENGIANATGFSLDTVVNFNGQNKNFAGGFIFGEFMEIHWDSARGSLTPPGYGDERWDGAIYQSFIKKPYFYDAALDSFFEGTDIPGPGRSNAVAMILDGEQTVPGRNPKLYAGLGDNDAYNIILLNIYLKDWYSYDFVTGNWKQERNLPDTGKSNAGSFTYEHLGYVVCGYDGEWKKNFFIYNTEDEDWTRYPDYRDSARSLGAGFAHGNRGFYGAGFKGNSDEMKTFSWYNMDTNSIRLFPNFAPGDTFCAGADITFDWASAINFNAGAKMVVQISDKNGIFEWPMTNNSNMDTFDISGQSGTITSKIPLRVDRGSQYKIRIISTSPFYISRFTDTFFVKENPKFKYAPKVHPFIDTVCLNADYFIPSEVSGDNSNKGKFDYLWIKNGTSTGQTTDTLFLNAIQFADAGEYRLVAQGDCYADTSVTYYISVENIPAPVISDNLDYPGMVGDTLFICEYDTNTWYIEATGKKLRYQWYHNGLELDSRDNIEGLGGPVIKNLSWNMVDSGLYYVRAVEACGAYTQSNPIIVKMRDIPRIKIHPKQLDSAVLEGTDVIFNVVATGYDLSYQWRKEAVFMVDNGRITGTQTPEVTIRQVIPSDVAFYSCIVTGGCPGFADTSNL
ncbi:MAG: immunoglobulin domain-containing protein, partial [Bacteroidota bacterium]|nr:immunoglobulin domain-containing protein [Bacteroidota bacterium]MDX5431511.1 immunoglobulin domain-containing protein [Bacteroidota bacterium]MDX5470235.1 immunoglobulin domain-containing protein [Bacteroidota bacterium]